MAWWKKRKQVTFDHDRDGYPTELIGVKVEFSTYTDADIAEKEKTFNQYIVEYLDWDVDKYIIFEDDGDLKRADAVVEAVRQGLVDKWAGDDGVGVEEDVYTGESASTSKLFVTSTVKPTNTTAESQPDGVDSSSVASVAKLSVTTKKRIEGQTGVQLTTDAKLQAAKDKALADAAKRKIPPSGPSATSTLLDANPTVTSEIEDIEDKISAIETSRDACPDWASGCPINFPDLDKYKDKLSSLVNTQKWEDMYNQFENWILSGKFSPDCLKGLLDCPTYLLQKGVEGVRRYGQISEMVQKLDGVDYLKRLIDANDSAAGGISALPKNQMGVTVRAVLGSSADSGKEIDLDGLNTIFSAIAAGDVSFTAKNFIAPFDYLDREASAIQYTLTDYDKTKDLAGANQNGVRTSATTSDGRSMLSKVAQMLNVDEVTLVMDTRLNNEKNVANNNGAATGSGDEAADVVIRAVKARSPGIVDVDSKVSVGEYEEVINNRKETLVVTDAMNHGDMSLVDPAIKIVDMPTFQAKIAANTGNDKPTIPEFYGIEYDAIMAGYAA